MNEKNRSMQSVTINIRHAAARILLSLVVLTAPIMTMWGQETNKKFAMTTQMFINELQQQKEQAASTHRAPARRLSDGSEMPKPRRLIASPDTIGGVAYISCFVHLSDPSDLSAVRALGVKVQGTFDGLDFITASVPVNQLEALAAVANVTNIEVSRLMRPTTNVARQKTNVDDLLTTSASATALGIDSQYDGTGVVLGIVDTGIDFQHIAFKDKSGNSRIKRAYIYNGTGSGIIYKDMTLPAVTTDDDTQDHGTHVASTAGGSSVNVTKNADDNFTITVTDDHANATYGGMAPGADLYLAGVKDLKESELINAIRKIVLYADSVGKPVVVSNSWGSQWGPHDGTGTLHTFVSEYFGDSHPGHIILFASSNDAGHRTGSEGGGFFVKKSSASQDSPLATILRTHSKGGNTYAGQIASAWAASKMNCKLYVLDNATGEVKASWPVTKETKTFDGLDTYYTGAMTVYVEGKDSKYCVGVEADYLNTTSDDAYTLALEVYPEVAETTADINMWAGDLSYFTSHLTTDGHTWIAGTDDMCVDDEATIPDAISVGAYVSRSTWTDYTGAGHNYTSATEDDIASFSSYATAELSPTGEAYPWITAPGAAIIAGVNHHHTGADSYFSGEHVSQLIVNNAANPYGKMQGTSMATPVAAGIVALWLQAARTLTVSQVKQLMRLSAINDTYTTTGANASHFGHGKIDALEGLHIINNRLSQVDATETVSYMKADGTSDNHTATLLNGNSSITTLTPGWYAAKTNVTYNGQLQFSEGDVNLILCDGATLTVTSGTSNALQTTGNLTIYGQSAGSGILETTTTYQASGIRANNSGHITINGGHITTNSTKGPGISTAGDITINGGNIETACSTDHGLRAQNITLGWRNAADRIKVKKYELEGGGSLSVAADKAITDANGHIYSGTLNTEAMSAIANTSLMGTDLLYDAASNATSIAALQTAGKPSNITFSGRTLYKDGNWNTLCLPFDVTISGSVLNGATVKKLANTSNLTDGTLTLNFEDETTTMKASTPYIIKWTSGANLVNPTFTGVTITSTTPTDATSTDGQVTFVGRYSPFEITNSNINEIILLSSGNKLGYSKSERTIANGKALRAFGAHFRIPTAAGAPAMNNFVINFDSGDTVTGILEMRNEGNERNADAWYTLDGRRIADGQMPTAKGIYIHGGRKVVVQ